MDRPKTHPYCSRKYQVPVWHKPYKPILSKEERATPMLLCRQPEHVKGFDKKRIKQLATPKKDHLDLLTKPPLKITWGNQEPLWSVNKTKSNDELSPLFCRLAQPKKNHASAQRVPIPHFEFSCGRSSPIRECRAPKKANCSARLTELAKHKNRSGDKNHQTFEFSCGRTSPIWKVSQRAKYGVSSTRVDILAMPKQHAPGFVPDRPINTIVSKNAKRASMTERLELLAKAKDLSNLHYFIDARKPEESITKVKKGALVYEASDRLKELAKPDEASKDFEFPNLEFWRVKRGALKAKCSDRFNELAKHVTRQSMDSVQYDQNAFTVSAVAKKAKCSDRLQTLAQPIQR